MPDTVESNILVVHASEGGQKLLQFLNRRLNLSQSLLHRWIRTGQIRVNGGRTKPFLHISENDMIRLPPFALNLLQNDLAQDLQQQAYARKAIPQSLPLPNTIYNDEHLLVLNKPCGLPVHLGTGHTDSLATRLSEHFCDAPFKPTPAHRLDKATSGVMLVAQSYACLRALQDAFEQRTMCKEYLAWVCGDWPYAEPRLLTHHLGKSYIGDDEKVRILSKDEGKISQCIAFCLHRVNGCSLMQIKLITGRTHQIRVQLAAEGYAVLGDYKYGQNQQVENVDNMYLHALRIVLPHTAIFTALNLQDKNFAAHAPWQGWQAVENIPDPLTELAL